MERHDPLGNAPIELARRRRPPHADDHAAARFDHFEARIGLAGELGALAHMQRIAAQIVPVQEGDVHRVDAALQGLQPVAFLGALTDEAVRRGHRRPFEIRQRRLLCRWAHIDPDHVAKLGDSVGRELDLLAEAALDRFRRHFDALPGDVVFPAVIGAAQPVFLVAAEPQRHAAMGAEFVHHADAACGVAKCDQSLAEKFDPHRRAIGFRNFRRQQRRNPIAPHQLAHRRCGTGQGEEVVLLGRRHGRRIAYYVSARTGLPSRKPRMSSTTPAK